MDTSLTTQSYVQSMMDALTEEQQVEMLAKFMGYGKIPPTIEEFVCNDYYLGKVFSPKLPNGLYPYWMDKLKEIFPNPVICRYPYLSLGGAIGTGKSTVSKIIALYNVCKLDHMEDPWRSLGISRTKDIAFTFIHTNAETANKEFIQSIKDIMEQSPYFCNPIHSLKHYRLQAEGTRNTKSLGTDSIFYVLSEVNFWKPAWVSKDKMDTAMGRYTSRFNRWQHYNGGIIFDTSAKGDAAVMEKFVKENALGDKLLTIRASQWEVKGNERGGFFQSGGFWVYAGDSMKTPFILKDDETPEMLAEGMNYDKDRFIYVPNELYAEFKSDIIKALNDKAGYSTHSTGKFFEDPTMVTKCVKLPKLNDDVVSVDFYDTNDKLMYKLQDAVNNIDPLMPCYIHIDMGYVSDLCGLSLIQFKNWVIFDKDGKTKYPSFRVPLSVGISRKAGQETSVLHIYDFIMELSKKYEIASVSYDSHQTRPIAQELTRAGMDNRYVSVDRTTEPYIVLKNLMGRGLVEIPDNELLQHELVELRYEGNKIDHTVESSKDISDSLCGAIYNAYTNIDMASEPSQKTYNVKTQTKLLDMVSSNYDPNTEFFRSRFSNMFNR